MAPEEGVFLREHMGPAGLAGACPHPSAGAVVQGAAAGTRMARRGGLQLVIVQVHTVTVAWVQARDRSVPRLAVLGAGLVSVGSAGQAMDRTGLATGMGLGLRPSSQGLEEMPVLVLAQRGWALKGPTWRANPRRDRGMGGMPVLPAGTSRLLSTRAGLDLRAGDRVELPQDRGRPPVVEEGLLQAAGCLDRWYHRWGATADLVRGTRRLGPFEVIARDRSSRHVALSVIMFQCCCISIRHLPIVVKSNCDQRRLARHRQPQRCDRDCCL